MVQRVEQTLPRLTVRGDAVGAPRVVTGRSSCLKIHEADLGQQLGHTWREAFAASAPQNGPAHGDLGSADQLGCGKACADRDEATLQGGVWGDVEATTGLPHFGWYVSRVSSYLLRPNAQTAALAAQLGESLGLGWVTSSIMAEDTPRHKYVGVHIRRGDKRSEALIHATAVYAKEIREAALRHGASHVLLASDDKEPYEQLPLLLPELQVVWLPHHLWTIQPGQGTLVAAKALERRNANRHAGPAPQSDEGMLLLAQAMLLSRAVALVGTLTSNYLYLALDLAIQNSGQEPPELIDLDNNPYFPCSVGVEPPWGAVHGRSGGPRAVPVSNTHAVRAPLRRR